MKIARKYAQSACPDMEELISLPHHHYGSRDIETKGPPDNDTLYWIGSLSKGMATAAVGVLIDEGRFNWSTPVPQVLPEFTQRDKSIKGIINITNILAHWTGISGPNAL